MKLCLISHAYLEVAYRHVLEALATYPDVELAWITPSRYTLNLQTSSGDLGETSTLFRTYGLPTRWAKRQGTFVYHTKPLNDALDDFKPDIILHEQEVFALGAGQIALVAKKRKIPLVMFLWENVFRSLSLPRRWLRSLVLQRCAGLIVGSTGSLKLHRAWGFRGPIIVLPQMGVSLDPEPVYGARNPGAIAACFVGRLLAMKGVDCLLRAVAVLHSEAVPIRCTIAGRGDSRAELEELCQQLHIEAIVNFVGALLPEDTKALMRRSDVLVLPSRRTKVWEEQFGRVLVEAMAQATIPVGSRTGAIGDVIGVAELLFDEDDFNALANILRQLASDTTLLVARQHQMWERARDHYTSSVVTERKIAFLREVLASTAHSS